MRSEAEPLSFLALALFETILSVSLAIPPLRLRGFFLLSLLSGLCYHILQSTTGDPRTDWLLALSITPQMGKALDVLWLVDAEKTLRKHGDLEVHPNRLPFWQKLCWSVEVIHTPRGVGWNWETPYICYSDCGTRRYLNYSVTSISVYKGLGTDYEQGTSSVLDSPARYSITCS